MKEPISLKVIKLIRNLLQGKNRKRVYFFLLSVPFILVPGLEESPHCASFQDALGRKVVLIEPPRRIIPLAPSLTEILYFLGLGDKVVGVTQFSYFPPEAALKPKVGSYIQLNVERIISLSPDLVIGTADGNRPYVVELLEQADIPVFIINPRNIRQIINAIAQVGKVCGIAEKGIRLAESLNARIRKVQEKTSRERPLVFLQINIKPIMTVNKNTFHNDLIWTAGGINMARDELVAYPRISIEEIIRRKPEVIIISSMERGGRFEEARREWLKWPLIPAVRNNRVHLIESDLIDRPSPRIIKGLEKMGEMIHPGGGWEKR